MFSVIRMRMRLSYRSLGVMVLFLLAMTGGAEAANRYLITSTKQISPKVLKGLRGRDGARGGVGAIGAQGPAGPVGAQGPAGQAGKEGALGKEGVSGKEGKAGLEGKEGSPWSAGGTLPSGKTEMGDWDLFFTATASLQAVGTGVSFVIPLAKAPKPHYIRTTGKEPFYNLTTKVEEERAQSECPGTVTEPKAEPGSLCVYASLEEDTFKNLSSVGRPELIAPAVCSSSTQFANCVGGADKFGFDVETVAEKKEENVVVSGTWAVTAE